MKWFSGSLLLGGALSAQAIVVPSVASSLRGGAANSWQQFGESFLPWTDCRVLFLYDVNDLPVPAAQWSSVQLRRSSRVPYITIGPLTVQLSITMSLSPLTPFGVQSAFASNHGPTPTSVFQGPVSFPPVPLSGWEPPIGFLAPFTFVGPIGKSLAVELTAKTTPTAGAGAWLLESFDVFQARTAEVLSQPACKTSTGGTVGGTFGSWTASAPVIGSAWTCTLLGYPSNQPSLHMNALCIGLSGPGGSWGGLGLPFPLASVSIPAPSGCEWGIDVVATAPMQYVTGSSASPNAGSMRTLAPLQIPNDRGLYGQSFFTQVAAVDTNPVTLQPEVFPSNVLRSTVGYANAAIPYSMIAWVNQGQSATGEISRQATPLRFQ